jgi:hypothetical protein
MIGGSIPKLLQEANEVRQALEKIGAGLPAEISAAGTMLIVADSSVLVALALCV